MGSVVVAHGLSCSVACGVFPEQGSNLCPLHWQVDSYPLHHWGSPSPLFLKARILGWQSFVLPFSILNRLLHCLLACIASMTKSAVSLIFIPLYIMCLFFLWVFKIFFSLSLVEQLDCVIPWCSFLHVSELEIH